MDVSTFGVARILANAIPGSAAKRAEDAAAAAESAAELLQPPATDSDVGKALIAKTVEDGKVTEYEYGEAGGGTVTDVQVNGTSVVTDGVANVSIATSAAAGVVKVDPTKGVKINNGVLGISEVGSSPVRQGITRDYALTPFYQHSAAFYGLAKAAGADMKDIANPTTGTYPDAQKAAIQHMLGTDAAIADYEADSTADQAYAVGELFMLNGKLHQATAAIAVGDTLTVGTNCAVVNAADVFPHDVQVNGTSVVQDGVANIDTDDLGIAQTVTNWLGQHVDPDTGYVIDDTLSIAEAAADAKKVGDEFADVKSDLNEINPQIDVFNLYNKANNIVGKYIDNSGNIQSGSSTGVLAKVAVENGKTYTICRPTYQAYSSGRMLVVQSDGTTVLATVNLDNCTSVQYGTYIAKKYTVVSENAAYILFNVKLATNDSVENTIVTARDINGSQAPVLIGLYDVELPTLADVDTLDRKIDHVSDMTMEDYRVSLLISGDNYQVRSAWDSTNDIAIKGQFHGSSNGGFRFYYISKIPVETAKDVYGGTSWVAIDDDIAPIKFSNSFMGGNHGYAAAWTLTSSAAHGITAADIGKTITDSSNNEYAILSVPTTKTLFVCSTYTGTPDTPLSTTAPVSPVTLGGTSYTFTVSGLQQLRPAINNIVQSVRVDGVRVVSQSGVYDGRFVDIAESYDIINIPEMLEYLEDNVGSNTNASYYSDAIASYCTVSNVYRFTEKGAVTIYSEILFHTAIGIEYISLTQSGAMGGQYISIPQSTKNTLYNMGTSTTNINNNTWSNTDKPPKIFYDFSDSNLSSGMAIGYQCAIGDAEDSIRKLSVLNAGQYYGSTHKIYPHLKDSFTSVDGQLVTAVCFRTPTQSASGYPAVSWYYVGDTPYVLINAQASMDGYVKLADNLCGKTVTVIDSDGAIDIKSAFVNNNGLYISVTDYGFAWVRLDN